MRPGERFLQVFNEDFGPFLANAKTGDTSAIFHCYPVPDFADRLMRLRAKPDVVIYAVDHIAGRIYESGVPRCLFPEWKEKVEEFEYSIKRITALDLYRSSDIYRSSDRYNDLVSALFAVTDDFLDILYQKVRDMDSVTRERWLSICNANPLIILNSVSWVTINTTTTKISEFTLITNNGITGNKEHSYLDSDTEDEMFLKALRSSISDAGYKKELPDPFFQDDLKFFRDILLRDVKGKVGEKA